MVTLCLRHAGSCREGRAAARPRLLPVRTGHTWAGGGREMSLQGQTAEGDRALGRAETAATAPGKQPESSSLRPPVLRACREAAGLQTQGPSPADPERPLWGAVGSRESRRSSLLGPVPGEGASGGEPTLWDLAADLTGQMHSPDAGDRERAQGEPAVWGQVGHRGAAGPRAREAGRAAVARPSYRTEGWGSFHSALSRHPSIVFLLPSFLQKNSVLSLSVAPRG